MKSLDIPDCKAEILSRIGNIRADSHRRWGAMTAPQMICHLNDCFLGVMSEKPISLAPGHYPRKALKFIALYAPFPWPKGVPTRPEFDQQIGGTSPGAFEEDRRRLLELVEQFTKKPCRFASQRHPMFLEMSERDWMRWGYLHTDHHLRQFGQ